MGNTLMKQNEEPVNESENEAHSLVKVFISEDKLSASINLASVKAPGECSVDDVMNALTKAGVKQGIKMDKIEEALNIFPNMDSVAVASGKEETNGEDGRFQYHFRTEILNKPKLLSDGSVDYKNMELFEQVKEGQLIAEYISATQGEIGFTVMGNLLFPKRGKDLPPIRGKGFSVSEDRKQYFSNITGVIELKDGRINIENCYIINKDVDTETGNIDFDGDVYIMGEVKSGFMVKATGHIMIDGHVEAAKIMAGKSILLKRGMQGIGGGFLHAKETISGLFFESVTIIAKQSVNANYLLNCNIDTQDTVVVSGSRGVIIGGMTKANKGITCHNLGNPVEKTTKLFVGVTQDQMDEYQNLGKQIAKIESEVALFTDGLDKIERAKSLTDQVITMKKKLNQAMSIKIKELNKLNKKHDELLVLINESSNSCVIVQGIVYPGVEVTIDSYIYKNIDSFRSVTFLRRGTDVVPEGIE